MEKKERYNTAAFEMLGGVEGVRALANSFYDTMSSLPEAHIIRDMHPRDLETTRENFTLFLCGWLGGPSLYKEKYGFLDLTGLHTHLKINEPERDMWLSCMELTIAKLDIEDDLKNYLLERFRVPAEKIRNWCQQQFLQFPSM